MNEQAIEKNQEGAPGTSAGAKASSENSLFKNVKRFWWVFPGFFIPYAVCLWRFSVTDEELNAARALRAGLIGLGCAASIWGIWRIDVMFGTKQRLSGASTAVKVLTYFSGLSLWVCWLVVGVVIAMAYDQVYDIPPLLPNLPE